MTLNLYPAVAVPDTPDARLPPNPLQGLASVLTGKGYLGITDISVVVGFHMKLVGIDWRSNDQLIEIILQLYRQEFLQVMPGDPSMLRLNPHYASSTEPTPAADVVTSIVGSPGPCGASRPTTYITSDYTQ